ncbi:MAG TPA: hypothetical protein VFB74_07690 [Kribbellaceae bacterium]|nr:hypothetical protein [Kribbellaceae bacterium]
MDLRRRVPDAATPQVPVRVSLAVAPSRACRHSWHPAVDQPCTAAANGGPHRCARTSIAHRSHQCVCSAVELATTPLSEVLLIAGGR